MMACEGWAAHVCVCASLATLSICVWVHTFAFVHACGGSVCVGGTHAFAFVHACGGSVCVGGTHAFAFVHACGGSVYMCVCVCVCVGVGVCMCNS